MAGVQLGGQRLLREARAHPGRHNYSSAGIGSSTHLAMAYCTAMAGVEGAGAQQLDQRSLPLARLNPGP